MIRTPYIVKIACPDCGNTWTATAHKEYGIMNFDDSRGLECENCGCEGEPGDCTYFHSWEGEKEE